MFIPQIASRYFRKRHPDDWSVVVGRENLPFSSEINLEAFWAKDARKAMLHFLASFIRTDIKNKDIWMLHSQYSRDEVQSRFNQTLTIPQPDLLWFF